ncbi:MAG: hypothetical protein HZB86_04670 [Deltaproteobacteria bacterium]|nr:hypothetical protein [Deltaproteobacteria bacterium]
MNTTQRIAGICVLLVFSCLPQPSRGADDAVDPIERELAATLKEMDALSAELDRIEEIAATPKATSVRFEIRRSGNVPAPAALRLYLSGKPEPEREWTKADRDRFLSGTEPVVFVAPILPGTQEARVVLTHPTWKVSPSRDFRPAVSPGGTFLLRLTLAAQPDGNEPSLVPSPEK